ncbi:MFS transporter [Desulfocurvibacter africanus]|uniref:Major facilitator superfamily MFS_1 n=2 Tax=Desulfocurvibacter africanus TaxID=873 RepID=F3YYA0_DESAF|nr:MFS transporter [Desulfocurvibacter africanus]EGJ49544.1 major facilitator superfamily MFS_1 [Desulfocurvibacter africanus subsp. africanus str. Walvis Bay]
MRKLYLDPRLQMVFGVTLMVVLGVSSIFPVIPDIMAEFGLSPAEVGLIITAFTLPGIVMAPVGGMLADRLGRKAVLVPALVLFGVAGTLCAFAPSLSWLLGLRFLQGMGAGALGVLTNTLIGDLCHGPQLTQAMGYNAGVLSFGTAIYPAIGGMLGLIGWHVPFILPIVALPLAWVIMRKLDVSPPERSENFGAYLRSALKSMRNGPVRYIFLATTVSFILLYGPVVTFLPILLSKRFEASPATIGLIVSSASLFSALASSQLGRLSMRFGETRLLGASYVFYTLSFGLVPFLNGKWLFFLPLGIFGMAQGLAMPSITTLLTRLAPREYRGGYMAVYGMLLRLSQTVAPPLMAGVHALFGIAAVYWTGSALALAMLVTVLLLLQPSACRAEAEGKL